MASRFLTLGEVTPALRAADTLGMAEDMVWDFIRGRGQVLARDGESHHRLLTLLAVVALLDRAGLAPAPERETDDEALRLGLEPPPPLLPHAPPARGSDGSMRGPLESLT